MTVSTTTLQVTFVSESAAYENTFGWYNKVTGYGGILFADVEAQGANAPLTPGVSSTTFTVNTADLANIQFFLISDGYDRNSGDDFTGAVKVIRLSDGSWAVANVDSQGRVITRYGRPDILVGEGANALFTETSKNAGGVDYASSVTGANQTATTLAGDTTDGATGLIAWEDIAATRKSNGSYTKPGDADYNDAVFHITTVNANHAPVANADSVSVGEDAGASTVNVLGNDTDPDAGDTLRVASVNAAGLIGTVTIGAGGANIIYTPAASFQSLAAGETATETFSYTVSDAAGATSTASVTVTVVGANDAPTVGAPVSGSGNEGGGTFSVNLLQGASDVDHGAVLHVANVVWQEVPGSLPADFTLSPDGNSIVVNTNGLAYNGMAQGQTFDTHFSYDVVDQLGALVHQSATVRIVGTNDAPAIQLPPGAPSTIATVQEDAGAVSGQLNAIDPDAGAHLTWTIVGGTASHHVDYTFAIDQLRIVRFNDNANPLFVDNFDDGAPPPNSPPFNPNTTQNATSYGGLTGTFTETGGRAILDSDLAGAALGVGTPDAFVANTALVRSDIANFNANPSLTPGLKSNVPFVVEGTFDLVLPDDRREAYGIRLTDRLTGGSTNPPDQPGDDGLDLVVRMGIDGIVRVQLVEVDVLNDQYNILGGTQLNAAGYEQVKLRLQHSDPVNNSGRITASFDLIDSDGILPTTTTTLGAVGRIFGTETPGSTGDDENWTRAQIVAYAPEESGSSLNGQYGTLTVRQDGSYFYNPGNNLSAVQALAQGETVYDDFQVQVTDELGATDIDTVRIAVQGTNDAPVVSAAVSGGGNEDASFAINLLQNASDVDHDAVLHVANVVWDEAPGNLLAGFAIVGDSITVDATDGAYQGQAEGETFSAHFTYNVVDELGASTVQHATVVITGTNDAPVVLADTTRGDSAGTATPLQETDGGLTASGTLTASDADISDVVTVAKTTVTHTGPTGSLTDDQLLGFFSVAAGPVDTTTAASGQFGWNFNSGTEAFNFLAPGEILTLSYTIRPDDGRGTTTTGDGVVTITIAGTNDAPTITGNDTGTVTEDQPSALQSRGNLFSADPDGGPASWSIVGGTTSATTQDFRFQMDNLKVVKNGGTFFEDPFGDGNPPPSGPNFPPATGINSSAYSLNGTFTEAAGRAFFDGTRAVAVGAATGVRATLNSDTSPISDPVNGTKGLKRNSDFTAEARFDLVTPQDGGDAYGLRLTDTNSPVLNSSNDSAADLVVLRDATGVHVVLREINSFTGTVSILQSIDLTPPAQSQIVLRLSYDDLSYVDVANGGSVTAAFDIVTNGVVVSTTSFTNHGTIFQNEDFTRVQLLGQAGQGESGVYKLAGTYGTLTVAQDGEWHYFLADQQANVQALTAGQTVQDTFTIRVSDGLGGLTDKIVTVNVNGVNEPNTAAQIGTPSPADVTEDLAIAPNGNLTVSGTISIIDPDPGQAAFQTAVTPFPAALGTLTLASNGNYTYSVANSAVQFLAANQIKTNTFTVTSIDGTQRQVVFTIHGANDNPTAGPDANATDAVIEANGNVFGSGDAFTSGNLILNDSDVDQGDLVTVTGAAAGLVGGPITTGAGSPIVGTYGTLTLFGTSGAWSYQLDNADPDTNALTDGQIGSDVFSYSVSDGHGGSATSTLTIAINGVNDAPSSPQTTLPVLEGTGQYQIDLLANVTDPEGDAFHVENINALHQAFTINPDGSSLTFDSNDPFVDLPEGVTFTVSAEYDLVDSHGARSHQVAFVTVTGVNDAPTVVATDPGFLIEKGQRWDVGITYANSFIDFHDPDSPLELDMTGWADNHNGTWSRAGVYGTATFDGRQLDYNLNSSDPDTIALDTGDVRYDTFTVTARETNGSLSISKDTTFEIHGRSDMYGFSVTYDYGFPTDQTVFHRDTAIVTGGIEVTEMSPYYSDGAIDEMIALGWVPIGFTGPDPGHVDFTRDQIIFTFDEDWSYSQGFNDFTFLGNGGGHVGPPTQEELDNASNNSVFWRVYDGNPFNGAHVTFNSGMPDLTWVDVNPSSTATYTGLRFDHDNLYLDLQGKSFTAGQKIVLDLTFYANGDWLT